MTKATKAMEQGKKMARETAEALKGADLLAWASEMYTAAAQAQREGHKATAIKFAAAGTTASELA